MFISQRSDQTLGTRTANKKNEGECLLAWPALCNWVFLSAVYGHGILGPGTGQDLFHKPPNRDPFEDRADTRGGGSRFQPGPTNGKGGHWPSVRAKGEWAGGSPLCTLLTPREHPAPAQAASLRSGSPSREPYCTSFLGKTRGRREPQSTTRKGAESPGSACLTPECPLCPHREWTEELGMGRKTGTPGRPPARGCSHTGCRGAGASQL